MAQQTKEPSQQINRDETNGHAQMNLENSIEFRLLQAYSERKKSPHTGLAQNNGVVEAKAAASVPSGEKHKAEKKKRKKRIRFQKLISCIRPAKEDNLLVTEPASDSCPEQEVKNIVNKLTKITDSVHFTPNYLESDSDDVVEKLVDLLREQGDKLDEEIKKNHILMQKLQELQSYTFFQKLSKRFLSRLSPKETPPSEDPKQAEIALICELTRRVMIMDRHPMNRVLGFGTQYLQENYTAWVSEKGGYSKIFNTDDDPDEDVQ